MLAHHARVIVNPMAAGGVTRLKWLLIRHLLKRAGLTFDYDFTEGVGHGTELAKAAVANGYELVVAVGGDGTVNEVVNGLVDFSGQSQATLGLICTGISNDFARSVGIPQGYRKACRQLARPKEITIDVGAVEYTNNHRRVQRLFVNMAGLGFDAAVLEATKRRFKLVSTKFPYWVGALVAFATYHNKEIALTIDGIREDKRALSVIVNNGYSFAGGMHLTPDADLSDGLLDTIVVGDLGKMELVQGLPRAYKGTLASHPKVSVYKAAHVEVASSERMLLQVDGELLGEAPARFWVLPHALRIAVYNADS